MQVGQLSAQSNMGLAIGGFEEVPLSALAKESLVKDVQELVGQCSDDRAGVSSLQEYQAQDHYHVTWVLTKRQTMECIKGIR